MTWILETAKNRLIDRRRVEVRRLELLRFDSGPVVRLSHAVAVGYSCSWEVGLGLVDSIEDLEMYQPWHAARAAFEIAISLSRNSAEGEYLVRVQATANPS